MMTARPDLKAFPHALAVAGFIIALFFGVQVQAAEIIKTFRSDIDLAKSGVISVVETITVNVENREINHGLFRDFPLAFEDEEGRYREVDMEVISLERDGKPEPYHLDDIANGVRIYFGSKDVILRPGIHTYKFAYKTARQARFHEDRDELYWNVTGTGWIFPIEKAVASIGLPGGIGPTDISLYTGAYYDSGEDARAFQEGGRTIAETTRVLGAGEGLTVSLDMPAGTIDPPTDEELRKWWWRDNRNTVLGVVAALLVWGWYGWSWSKVGRDPPRGVVVPRWDAPDGISPALANYIDNKGFLDGGWKAFSAASISLAVKGLLTLDNLDTTISMRIKEGGREKGLPPGEAAIYERVRLADDSFRISKSNGESVKNLGQKFTSAIEAEHRGKFYHLNEGYVVFGVVLSVLSLVTLYVMGRFSNDGAFMSIFPNIAALVIGIFVGTLGRGLKRASLYTKIMSIIILGIVGVGGIGFIGLLFIATGSELYATGELPVILAMNSIIIANVIFFFIMGAPTPLGSKMMDGIDGLRQYLTLAEKDRMNMAGAPKMSPQHFETLLPYAVALGVERPWSNAFDEWLSAAKLTERYQPAWYHGGFDHGSFGRDIGGFSSSMASTVKSTLPAPPRSSSGSGGGGFSGGGGGGGGGGGW